MVTVRFTEGAWTDAAGNLGVSFTQQFAVLTQAQSFFIELGGGVILSAAGYATLFEAEANVQIELDFARSVFSLDFNGRVTVIGLGTIGSSAGRFVLDTSGSDTKFWGVMTVETDFTVLEQYGVFMFGRGTLTINTTSMKPSPKICIVTSGVISILL